ncbi:hypothetical protein, partial [Bifidobacterium longum]|uniref:hypothetical protein n=2 Tax=Bifidobacterium longum TaxID=216816 RepID=UPI001BE3DF05
ARPPRSGGLMAPLGSWTLQGDRFGDGSHARTVSEDAKDPAIVIDHIERRRERMEPFGLAGLEGHESPSRTDRGADADGVAAPVWDEGRRVSAHRFGIRHPTTWTRCVLCCVPGTPSAC